MWHGERWIGPVLSYPRSEHHLLAAYHLLRRGKRDDIIPGTVKGPKQGFLKDANTLREIRETNTPQ
jgi:hypothetical protein